VRTYPTTGFSLVELSIVLVILGLLVGGVLSGQSLIRASELRSIPTQYSSYVTAVNLFKDKYFALPGDMPNATALWGIAAGVGNDATCRDFVSTGVATCNGDGNNLVETSGTRPFEEFRFWQHLSNAGLIEGRFSGSTTTIPSTNNAANVPSGKISNTTWNVYNGTSWYASGLAKNVIGGMSFADAFNVTYDNFMFLVSPTPSNNFGRSPALLPQEMWNLDTKVDDGMPAVGKVVVSAYGGTGIALCTNTSLPNNFAATYLLTGTSKTCSPIFRQAF